MERVAIQNGGVKSIINQLNEEKARIEGYRSSISNEVGFIDSAWDGADALAYMNKMQNSFDVLISDYVTCLQSYIDFLSQVYGEYEEFDNQREAISF